MPLREEGSELRNLFVGQPIAVAHVSTRFWEL